MISRLILSCALPLVGALWFAHASAATLCVNPSDPACHATIQAAVNVANPNDIILITPHPDVRGYRENVVIATPDLTLRGVASAPSANILEQSCPDVIVDGCQTPNEPVSCGAMVVSVDAANTRIERILLRNGYIAFTDGASGSEFSEACVIGAQENPIRNHSVGQGADDLVVSHSIFQGGASNSIRLNGDRIAIQDNHFLTIDDGIEIIGNHSLIANNEFRSCNDRCLNLSGDHVQVVGNRMFGGDSPILVVGDQLTIIDNVVEQSRSVTISITCSGFVSNSCTGGLIARNRVVSSNDDNELIRVFEGNQFIIEDNLMALATEIGLEFYGDNSIIRRNVVYRSGSESSSEACFVLGGSGNLVEDNQARLCSFGGFRLASGSDNIYRNNLVVQSGLSGIRICTSCDDTILDGNQVLNAHGDGISNRGNRTVIVNNILSGNRTDLCNNGSIAELTDNSFETGGSTTACVTE